MKNLHREIASWTLEICQYGIFADVQSSLKQVKKETHRNEKQRVQLKEMLNNTLVVTLNVNGLSNSAKKQNLMKGLSMWPKSMPLIRNSLRI